MQLLYVDIWPYDQMTYFFQLSNIKLMTTLLRPLNFLMQSWINLSPLDNFSHPQHKHIVLYTTPYNFDYGVNIKETAYGSMSILMQFMDGSLCLLSAAFTRQKKTGTVSYKWPWKNYPFFSNVDIKRPLNSFILNTFTGGTWCMWKCSFLTMCLPNKQKQNKMRITWKAGPHIKSLTTEINKPKQFSKKDSIWQVIWEQNNKNRVRKRLLTYKDHLIVNNYYLLGQINQVSYLRFHQRFCRDQARMWYLSVSYEYGLHPKPTLAATKVDSKKWHYEEKKIILHSNMYI